MLSVGYCENSGRRFTVRIPHFLSADSLNRARECAIMFPADKGDVMAEYENNAFFWQKLDTLYRSGTVDIVYKQGDRHPQFENLIFPIDCGLLRDTNNLPDGVSVYIGSEKHGRISAAIVAVDILQKSLDVKLLAGCNEEEILAVLRFLNQTDFQKTVLIRRGNKVPSWGYSESEA